MIKNICREKAKIYGVDVNKKYLEETRKRFHNLGDSLQLLCINLLDEVNKVPKFISCVIQINETKEFVSDSPYLHVFDGIIRPIQTLRGENQCKNFNYTEFISISRGITT